MGVVFQPLSCPSLLQRSFTVLVADDDPDVRDTLSEGLALCPLLSVRRASDPDEARVAVRGGGVDVCVLDLCFPNITAGLDLVREFSARMPLLAVSALATAGQGGEAKGLGARQVIDKPVCLDTLLPKVLGEALRAWLLHLAGIDPFLRNAVEVLCERSPASVSRWAIQSGKDLSYLRRCWREAGRQARLVLFVHRFYQAAFECFLGHEDQSASLRALARLRRLTRYAETHAGALQGYLPAARETAGNGR